MPFIDLNNQSVILRRDARWGPHNWTQWPQWYFADYDHFAYIRRRPAKENMEGHPFYRLWWDMSKDDFVEELGCGLTGIGRLRESIVNEFYQLRDDLINLIGECKSGTKADRRRLYAAAIAVRHCTTTLRWTPQTYPNVLQTVTTTQQHYLETQAMLEKLRLEEEPPILTGSMTPAADMSFMGTITDLESVASELFDKGVSVWFVQGGAAIPQHINIMRQMPLVYPHPLLGVVMDRWPGTPVFYSGPLSPAIYFATGKWRPGTIDLSRVGPEGLPPVGDAPPAPVSIAQVSPAGRIPSRAHAAVTSGPSSSSCVLPLMASSGKSLVPQAAELATHKCSNHRCYFAQENSLGECQF